LAFDANWERSNGAVRVPCAITKSNTALTNTTLTWGGTTTVQWVWYQFQSPLMAAGYSWTTSDTVSMVIRGYENNAQCDDHLAYSIRVVSADGTTVRGTVGLYHATSTELVVTTPTTRIHDARNGGASNFTSYAGDRIIVEIGLHGVTPSTSYTQTLRVGDPTATSDFALTAGLTTDLCPWVQLSRDVVFGNARMSGATNGTSVNNVGAIHGHGVLSGSVTEAEALIVGDLSTTGNTEYISGVTGIGSSTLETNLKAYYKLDETSGSVLDAKGDNDGTNSGGTPNQSGLLGTSYAFDGSDYIDCGNTDDLSSLTSEGSLSMWLYPTTLNTLDYLLISKMDMGSATNGYVIYIKDGTTIRVGLADASNLQVTSGSTITVSTGSWQHIVITWSVAQDRIRIYKNAGAPYETTCDYTPVSNVTNFLIARCATYGDTFIGRMDEIAAWNREITSTEISELYGSSSGKAYPFGGAGGATVSGTLSEASATQYISGTTNGVSANNVGTLLAEGVLAGVTNGTSANNKASFIKVRISGQTNGTSLNNKASFTKVRISGVTNGTSANNKASFVIIHISGATNGTSTNNKGTLAPASITENIAGTTNGTSANNAGTLLGKGKLAGVTNGQSANNKASFTIIRISGATNGTSANNKASFILVHILGQTNGTSNNNQLTLTGKGVLAGATNGTSDNNKGTFTGGSALQGTANGVALLSGILQATGQLTGAFTTSATVSGTFIGLGSQAGSSSGVALVSGILVGKGAIAGAVYGTSTNNKGTIVPLSAGSLFGSIYGTSIALLTNHMLIGHTNGVALLSGTILAKGVLRGVTNGVATVSGRLTAEGILQGTTTGIATVSATLNGYGALQGNIPSTAIVTGIMLADGRLSGTVEGVSNVTGLMHGHGVLAGVMNGTSSVTGLPVKNTQYGVTNGLATVSASIHGHGVLRGVTNGTATVIGDILGWVRISGRADGDALLQGILTGSFHVVGASSGVSLTGGLLRGEGILLSSANGMALAGGTLGGKTDLNGQILTTAQVTASLMGWGALSGSTFGIADASGWSSIPGMFRGEINGVAVVVGNIQYYAPIAGVTNGSVLVTGQMWGYVLGEVISGDSTITLTLSGDSTITATLTGDSTITAVIADNSLIK